MKRSTNCFISSFFLSMLVIGILTFAAVGVGKAYESMVYTSFGIKKSAVQLLEGGIRILDFEILF